MDIFNKNDFSKIPFLTFDSSFVIDDKTKIVFAFNGLCKTTLYNFLLNEHSKEYEFMDYSKHPEISFTNAGKNCSITTNLEKINLLKEKINSRKAGITFVKTLKNVYNLNNKTDAVRFSNSEVLKKSYTADFPDGLVRLDGDTANLFAKSFSDEDTVSLISKKDQIVTIVNLEKELQDQKDAYLLDILKAIKEHSDGSTERCPVCGSEGLKLLNIVESKIIKLEEKTQLIFRGIKAFETRDNLEKVKLAEDIKNAFSKLSGDELFTLMLTKGKKEEEERIITVATEVVTLQAELDSLESEQKQSYERMSENKPYIKERFEKYYLDSTINFDDSNFQIDVRLPRKFDTYSTGEFNEMLIIIKTLSFAGSSKEILIVDDPLSSFDFPNQYRIIFQLIKFSENKKIIILTHNIETINIANSQRGNYIEYCYIEKFNKTLFMQKILINERDSILSLNTLQSLGNKYLDLLVLRENCPSGHSFEGHKIFHYDGPYTFETNIENEKPFVGLSNEALCYNIDTFSSFVYQDFTNNTLTKIIYMASLRVWIEKQVFVFISKIRDDSIRKRLLADFVGKDTLLEKIQAVEDKPEFRNAFANFNHVKFMSKKVMLNQNSHYKSQIIPFNFAINISLDELKEEINDVKTMFVI